MLIRYFAGAAEAAGMTEESVDAGPLAVSELVARLGVERERLSRVLAVSALLVDGRVAKPGDTVAPGARVDVLPPFAGG